MDETRYVVIEDHALTRLGIQELLRGTPGFACTGSAATKREALDLLKAAADSGTLPDLIILDLFLGAESGMDIVRMAGAQWPGAAVVIYSMYSNPGIVSLALECGAKAFVAKDGPTLELLRAVTEVRRGNSYIPQKLIAPLCTYRNVLDSLTRQEQSILKEIIQRRPEHQIAAGLNITYRSFKKYLSRIYDKTGCTSHEDLIARFG